MGICRKQLESNSRGSLCVYQDLLGTDSTSEVNGKGRGDVPSHKIAPLYLLGSRWPSSPRARSKVTGEPANGDKNRRLFLADNNRHQLKYVSRDSFTLHIARSCVSYISVR